MVLFLGVSCAPLVHAQAGAAEDIPWVRATPSAVTVDEGGTATYTLKLTTQPTGTVTVGVNVGNAALLVQQDVTVSPASLEFPTGDWDTAQTVTVSAARDADTIDDAVTLIHSASGGGYDDATADQVAVTVTDDTAVTLTVSPGQVQEDGGARAVTVTGTLQDGPLSSDTTIQTFVGDSTDSATEGTDYATVGIGALFIPAGLTSGTATFTLTPTNDSVDEGDETLTIHGTTTAAGLAVTGTTLTIIDDERGVAVTRAAVRMNSSVLVSNTGQTDGGHGSLATFDQAQAFTTGSNEEGYTLQSVDIKFAGVADSSVGYVVTITENNASNRPGSLVGTLTSPSSIAANAVNTFTAPVSGIDLEKDTTYFIHVDSSSTEANLLRNTTSDNEDAGGESGWSIANGSLYRDHDDTSSNWQTWHESKSINIKGIVKDSSTPTLVSNTDQTQNSGSSGYLGVGNHDEISTQGFKTGTVYEDYTLESVGVYVDDEDLESGETLTVHIYTATGGGAKDTLVYTLTSPSNYTDGAENLFTAPAGATLDGNSNYLVVFEGTGNQGADFRVGLTNANAQDSDGLSTWSIENARRRNDSLESDGASFMIAVYGSTGSLVVNNPATGGPHIIGLPTVGRTLRVDAGDIADDDGLVEAEADTAGHGYTYQWVRVDEGAETPIAGETGTSYTLQVADAGQTIKVTASFADDLGNAESRTSAKFPNYGGVRSVITPTGVSSDAVTLVSNTGQSSSLISRIGGGQRERSAQRFSVPAGPDYLLEEVRVCISGNNESIHAGIYAASSGNANNPATGTLVHRLEHTSTSTTSGVTLSPPAGATLVGGQSYFVVVDGAHKRDAVCLVTGNDQDSESLAGWDIADASRFRLQNTAWANGFQSSSLKIRVTGVALPDASLSGLELQDTSDDSDIALTPTFATGVTSYTASVDNAVAQILVDPTTTDDSATVEYLDASDMDIDDADTEAAGQQVALAVGENTVKVRVTAEDSTGTRTQSRTYTVAVTRAAANNPATGLPHIIGLPTVGRTLRVDVGEIADDDGLVEAEADTAGHGYTYQWVRVDEGAETPIAGETGTSYTLQGADAGKTIKVTASFVDDLGNAETRTSAKFPNYGGVRTAITPTEVSSDAVTLVSNLGQLSTLFVRLGGAANGHRYAQRFSVPDGPDYLLEEVRVCVTVNGSNESIYAGIYAASSGDPDNPDTGTLVHRLERTSTSTKSTFTLSPPAGATLSGGQSYFVVVDGGHRRDPICLVGRNDLDSGTLPGWDMADNARYMQRGSGWGASTHNARLRIKVTGGALPDATLSGLELQDTSDDSDISLTPTFATGVTSYTASVANAVAQILVDPTTTEDGATVEFLDGNDMAIADADGVEDGQQVALAEGANTIKVKVTAEDTMATETYTVIVTRAAMNTPAESMVTVTPTALSVDEGGSGTYTVVLDTAPSGTVTVTIGGFSGTDVSVDEETLEFGTGDWNVAQTVTVSAAQDADGVNDAVTLTHTPTGGGYDGATGDTVAVTVADDERGITATPTSLTVREGGRASYWVVLDTQPTGTVTVTIRGESDTGLRAVTVNLTFTTTNWASPKEVPMNVGNDPDVTDERMTLTHYASGGGYDGVTGGIVELTVLDDDLGVIVTPTELSVAEGGTATYTVVLNMAPSDTVTVTVGGVSGTDVSVDDETLEFGTGDWNVAQTVTVSAAEDADGVNDAVTLTHTPSGGDYDGATGATVAVTVVDTTAAETDGAILVSNATQDAGTIRFATRLAQPFTTGANASGYTLSGVDIYFGEVTVVFDAAIYSVDASGAPASVLFDLTTPGTLSTGRNTFAAPIDTTLDPGTTYAVGLTPRAMTDPATEVLLTPFGAEDTAEPGWSIGDDYYARIAWGKIRNNSVLITVRGAANTFPTLTTATANGTTLVLTYDQALDETSAPATSAYAVSVDNGAGAEPSEVAVSGSTVTLTLDTALRSGQTVTVSYTVPASNPVQNESGDKAVALVDRAVTNNTPVGVTVAPTVLSIIEGGTATYTVVLEEQPTDTVTVTIGGFSGTDVSVDDATLEFTTVNWETAQTVTVSAAQDDDNVDDTVTLTHTASGGGYDDVAIDDVVVTVDESDGPEVSIAAVQATAIYLGEKPAFKFTWDDPLEEAITLQIQLSQDRNFLNNSNLSVSLNVSAGETEATAGIPIEWFLAFTKGEPVRKGTITATLQDGSGYSVGTASAQVEVIIAVTIGFDADSYTVNEDEGTVTLKVVAYTGEDAPLPGNDLFFTVWTEDVDAAAGEDYTSRTWDLQLSPTALPDSPSDFVADGAVYKAERELTVPILDDSVEEGSEEFYVALGQHMANAVRLPFHYRNFVLPNGDSCGLVCRVPITIRDDEAPTVTVTPLAVSVAEGGTVTYTVVLDSAPSADVTVTIDGFSGSDVSVNDATLEFTAVNWNMAQTVTVSAAEDADAVNDTVTLTHTASGGGYGNAAIDGVEVKVVDNDAPMVAASPRAFAIPEGESGTYTLTMTQAPSADVLVRVNLGTTEVVRYEFGTSNWMTVRTVTVNAPHDADHVDDDFTLTHTASGGGYDGVTIDDVVVTVLDDDVPGVTVTPTSLSVVKGEFADYTVALETEPEDDVRIAIDGLSHSLTFTTTNWPNPQTFRVHIPATSLYGILEFTHSASGGGYDDVAVDPVLITIIPAAQLELSSDPGVDENYVTGDVIEVEATFYTDVTVDTTNGTPSLALTVGNTARQAVYQSIDASNRILTFAYTVVAGDSDGDGVSVAADVLALNGGTIKKHGTSDDASLTNGALTDQSGHRVNTPPRGVTVMPAELSVDEGGSNTYAVVLDTQPSADVTVTIGGFSGTDVSVDDSTLEFTTIDWNTAQTVTVSAAEDDDPNHDAVTLTHTASGGGYDAVTIDDVEVTVSDNDTIAFTAEILPETDSVEEGETLEVTVRITASMAPEDSLTFRAYTNEGTATLTDDYISFLPSHQEALSADFSSQSDGTYVHEQTFDLETVEDAIAERDETLTFDITEPVYLADANYTSEVAGHEDGAEITIKDDDAGMTVTPTSLSVAEGGSNTYTVVLDAEPSGTVTVTIGGASGTDVSVDDPTLEFTTVNWNMAQTVTVSAAEDADAANDVVTLTHTASGGSYDDVPVAEVEVSVADNDARRVVVAPMQQGVHEGGSNTYTVVLSTEPTDDVTVTIAGFEGTGFSVNDPTLEFTAIDWSTAQTVTVSAAEDDNGVNEMVTLTHTASGGDYDDVAVAEVEVSVADNDGRLVVVAPTSLTVNEGGTKTYTVVLSTEPTDEVTVTIGGFSGTSISVHDSTLEFGTGDWDTAQTVTVSAAEDDNGVNETVTLTHTASGGDYADVAVAEVEVSVADNETASTAVALTVSPNSVEETDTATTVTVTGTLNGSPRTSDTTVTVSVGAPGDTATEGVDYARVGNLTLRIDAGETSGTGTFSLDPTADDVGEADEMLSVTGTTTATGLTVTSTTVTIVNKNAQPCFRTSGGDRESVTVSFCSGGSLNATEAGGVLTLSAGVRIQLDRAPRQTLTIPLTVEHRGGATAADYEGWPSSVIFGPDETEKKFIVSAVDDEEDDDEESLVLGFGEPLPEGVSVGEHRRMTILLHDDDGTETWYVSFEKAAYTATEGGAGAEVAVVLSEPWKPWRDQALTVPLYRPERRGGATGADYTGVPDSVTFQPGSTRATFTVRATDDAEDDDGESVLLQFRSGFPEDLKVGNGPRTATVRLADNDGAREVAVRFGAANITAVEGGADAELEVRLSAAPGRQVTVPITASLDGATSADYSGVPGSVTFGSFQTTATFTVRATDDAEDDDHERVTFGFGALPAAVIAGTPSSATLAITDNDGERTTYTVNFDAITGTVRQLREGGSYWLGVSLNKAAEHTIGIPLTVTHLDGATAADYTGLPATVVIEKGERKSGVIVGGGGRHRSGPRRTPARGVRRVAARCPCRGLGAPRGLQNHRP